MNWDAISAIAELLAAVGVIVSLIFVGLQVRKSNAEARAATMQATTDTEVFMNATMARHAGTWHKVATGVPLGEGKETRRGIVLYNLLMTDNENRFHQYQAGYYDLQSWNSRIEILKVTVQLPIFEFWRESYGGRGHGADFLAFIDQLKTESSAEQSAEMA